MRPRDPWIWLERGLWLVTGLLFGALVAVQAKRHFW